MKHLSQISRLNRLSHLGQSSQPRHARPPALARAHAPAISFAPAVALALLLGGCALPPPAAGPIEITLVAMNDFHGALEADKLDIPGADGKPARRVQAGGIVNLGAKLREWRKADPDLVLVGAGDLIGATPPASALWADEPTLEALDLLGLTASALGNHELDHGKAELLRQQRGGCVSPRPQTACKFRPDYRGAAFSYLAANVTDSDTGQPLLPAYKVVTAHGVKIGLVGAVLRDTPEVVAAAGIKGLRFGDEAEAVNRVLPAMRAEGVKVFVLLIHQGGKTDDAPDRPDCANLDGPIVDIAKRLDPAVQVVVSGHTHKGYLCRVEGRSVTQAKSAGQYLTRLTLEVDRQTHALRAVRQANVVVEAASGTPDAADAPIAALLDEVRARGKAALQRPVARLAVASVNRTINAAGESPLGDLVADAQLEATRAMGAQVAFMNMNGIRADLETAAGGAVNHARLASVQPFGNTLVLMTLSGAQIRQLLEQQLWLEAESKYGRNIMQVSDGFSYQWDSGRAIGQRVVPGSVMLGGKPLGDADQVRVVANNFLAGGGDLMSLFKQGTAVVDTGIRDIDALEAYLAERERAGSPAGRAEAAGRILRPK